MPRTTPTTTPTKTAAPVMPRIGVTRGRGTMRLHIIISPGAHALIKKAAESEGLGISVWVRRAIMIHLRRIQAVGALNAT